MNHAAPITAALLFLPTGDLSIDYAAARALEVSIETEVVSETTHMRMVINGEEREGGRFGGGGATEYHREVTFTESVLEHDEGAPTKVKRSFDTVSATRTSMRGEDSFESDIESPMEDVTLIVTLDEGDAVATLEDDEDPERSEMLEGHRLENLLHGLLPEGGDGQEWEPEAAGLASALLIDVDRALFPPPQFEEGGEEGGRGGGRRGGMRGGFGGSPLGFLREAEWDAKATRTDRTEDVDGVECIVIELELESEGEMPERQFGRGGRDRMAGATSGSIERVVENTYSVELSGELWFSLGERRPVKLELEGEFIQDTLTERETERGEFRMERTVEGSIEHTISISAEDA